MRTAVADMIDSAGRVIMVVLVVVMVIAGIVAHKEESNRRQKAATQFGSIEGEVASVETKKLPNLFEGAMIPINRSEWDRTVVTFKDGRIKEFVGVHNHNWIPRGHYVMISYYGNGRIQFIIVR